MSSTNYALTKKLRAAIKAKIEELGIEADDELPDYVMVLAANRKDKSQMKNDLHLFLNKSTDVFVDWLFDAFERIQKTTNESNAEKRLDDPTQGKVQSWLSTQNFKEPENQPSFKKGVFVPTSVSKKTIEQVEVKTTKVCETIVVTEKSKRPRVEEPPTADERSKRSRDHKSEAPTIRSERSRHSREKDRMSEKTKRPRIEVPTVATAAADDEEPKRSHAYARDESTTRSEHSRKKERTSEKSKRSHIEELTVDEKPRRTRNEESAAEGKPKKTRDASSSRHKEKKHKKSKSRRKETLRSPRSPRKRSSSPRSSPRISPRETPKHSRKRKSSPERSLRIKIDATPTNGAKEPELVLKNDKKFASPSPVIVEYSPAPVNSPAPVQSPAPVSTGRWNGHITIEDETSEEEAEIDAVLAVIDKKQFTNQVPPTAALSRPNIYATATAAASNELFLSAAAQMPLYDTQLVRAAERCRYWPSCEKGGACTFHHPSKLCTRFPNCYFGDQCNFIHPFCKFDTRCTKPQCPFFHTSREATGGYHPGTSNLAASGYFRPAPAKRTWGWLGNSMPMPIAKPSTTMSAVNAPSSSTTNAVSTALLTAAPLGDPASGDASAKATAAVPCRYKGQCTDANCVFLHPPNCRFGLSCRNRTCSFSHRRPDLTKYQWIAPST